MSEPRPASENGFKDDTCAVAILDVGRVQGWLSALAVIPARVSMF
jgi:hypothetical protein